MVQMPEWMMLLAIWFHIATAPAFDSRDDFRLTQPFEYGIDIHGMCVDYRELGYRPTIATVYHNVRRVERGEFHDSVTLYEDGSCSNN